MSKMLLFLFVLVSAALNAQQLNNPQQALNKSNKNFFIENKGQWDPEVKYLARICGMNAWITNSGVVYDYYKIIRNFDAAEMLKMNPKEKQDSENKNTSIQGHIIKLQLVNTEKNIFSAGNNRREGCYNYLTGNDKNKWASNVPLFDNIELQGIYKGIDVKYYYDNGMLRYDYKVKAGADISQLKFRFEGQNRININSNGEVVLKTTSGDVTNGKIYAYQMDKDKKKEVTCKFEQKEDGTLGLKAEGYDEKKELIIDPLVYSTFIGGSGAYDYGNSIAVDASGNAYITGQTASLNFPTTSGAYQTTYGGFNQDAFVTKLNSDGSGLVYSTYIGGNYNDIGYSIALDTRGDAFITGQTSSTNFPISNDAYQTTLTSVVGNAFVTELNSTGTGLIYSTYIGGSYRTDGEYGFSIAVDGSGNAYITGWTDSPDYPTTTGAYQTALSASENAFVTKLNSTGTALIYSTLIGGSNIINGDFGYAIAIDAAGNAYITGQAYSSDYPTTSGAYQTAPGIFVTKVNPSGSDLIYSTCIGGCGIGKSIAIDAGGNAYITGYTQCAYPSTSGAFQTASANCFVTKLNSTGSGLIYSTFIDGNQVNSIALDMSGNAYITGWTDSPNFPTTSDAYQTTLNASPTPYTYGNAFITEFNSTGSGLVYSTYIGGNTFDVGNSIAIDGIGNAYITGETGSTNFPVTSGAYRNTFTYGFVLKLNITSITKPDVIQQVSPFNGSTGNIQPIQFKWLTSARTSSYRLQVSKDSIFTTIIADTTGLTDTTYTLNGLSNLTTYFWRVNATNEGGTSDWSSVWKLKTLGNPTQPEIIYPLVNSSNIPLTVNFVWNKSQEQLINTQKIITPIGTKNRNKTLSLPGINKINNVSRYWFELMTDTTSASFVKNDSTLTDTTIQVAGLKNLTNYWWRVKGMNETGWGDYTNWCNFTTIIDTPGVVILISPNDSTTIPNEYTSILFTWESDLYASTYELQIATNINFNPVFFDTIGVADTTFNYHIFGGIPPFSWRVRASNFAGTGSWSPVMTVTNFLDLVNAKNGLPVNYEIYQNYPNPFNPSSKIRYALPFNSNIKIEVYNILGQKVRELLNEQKAAGYYEVTFNTNGLSSGIYLYMIYAKSIDGKSEYRNTKKMVFLK